MAKPQDKIALIDSTQPDDSQNQDALLEDQQTLVVYRDRDELRDLQEESKKLENLEGQFNTGNAENQGKYKLVSLKEAAEQQKEQSEKEAAKAKAIEAAQTPGEIILSSARKDFAKAPGKLGSIAIDGLQLGKDLVGGGVKTGSAITMAYSITPVLTAAPAALLAASTVVPAAAAPALATASALTTTVLTTVILNPLLLPTIGLGLGVIWSAKEIADAIYRTVHMPYTAAHGVKNLTKGAIETVVGGGLLAKEYVEDNYLNTIEETDETIIRVKNGFDCIFNIISNNGGMLTKLETYVRDASPKKLSEMSEEDINCLHTLLCIVEKQDVDTNTANALLTLTRQDKVKQINDILCNHPLDKKFLEKKMLFTVSKTVKQIQEYMDAFKNLDFKMLIPNISDEILSQCQNMKNNFIAQVKSMKEMFLERQSQCKIAFEQEGTIKSLILEESESYLESLGKKIGYGTQTVEKLVCMSDRLEKNGEFVKQDAKFLLRHELAEVLGNSDRLDDICKIIDDYVPAESPAIPLVVDDAKPLGGEDSDIDFA